MSPGFATHTKVPDLVRSLNYDNFKMKTIAFLFLR